MKSYVHHVPGRLRVRIPALRNNPYEIENVSAILNIRGTYKIKANPLTGSLVITYNPDMITAHQLLDIMVAQGYYRADQTITLDAKLNRASHRAARKVSKAMFGWAVGRLLEAKGLSLIAAFI
jgi:hypothetical protein